MPRGDIVILSRLKLHSDLHADYYNQFTSKRHNVDIGEVKTSYRDAYDTLESIDESDLDDDFGSAGDSGIGGSIETGELGGDLGGGEL